MINYTKKLKLIILFLFILLFIFSTNFWIKSQNKNLEVIFFDVGQGDSILIKTPSKNNILIDGGENSTVLYHLGKHLPFYEKTIDLMILTHPHGDHVGGLISVLEKYKVKKILGTGVVHTSPEYLKWLQIIKEKNIKFIKTNGYRKIKFLSSSQKVNDIILEILYPLKDISQNNFKDLNESSIVAKLTFDKKSFLFTGDLPIEGEKELLLNNPNIKADVLKVGHHGSKSSSHQNFLKTVSPKYAIIQVGSDNKFGHPNTRIIKNLEKLKINILRNDQLGTIIFSTDGKNLTLK